MNQFMQSGKAIILNTTIRLTKVLTVVNMCVFTII